MAADADCIISYNLLQGPEVRKVEINRIVTFENWPDTHPLDATSLARNGFQYKGTDDEIECTFCNASLNNVNSREALVERHKSQSPQCPVVLGKLDSALLLSPPLSSNETIGNSGSKLSGASRLELLLRVWLSEVYSVASPLITSISVMTHIIQVIYAKDFDASYRIAEHDTTRAAVIQTKKQRIPKMAPNTSPVVPDGMVSSSPFASMHLTSQSASYSSNYVPELLPTLRPASRQNPRILDGNNPNKSSSSYGNTLSMEQARLDTFSAWPKSDIISPSDLARSGFHHIGPEDRVQCHFCKGILRNWAPGDVPMDEHRRHFPECPFAANVTTDKIPLNTNTPDSVLSASLPRHEAKVPAMAIESTRVSSFSHWPSHLYQRPEDLARAGFFYTGSGDQVRCFYCGGVLHNWSRDDDVCVEHARWFPGCGYMQQVKGRQFIINVHKRDHDRSSGTIGEAPTGRLSPRTLKARMDLPTTQCILRQGYSHDLVRRAVEQQLRKTGDDFEAVEQLFDTVVQLKRDESMEETQSATQTKDPSPTSSSKSQITVPERIETVSASSRQYNLHDPTNSAYDGRTHQEPFTAETSDLSKPQERDVELQNGEQQPRSKDSFQAGHGGVEGAENPTPGDSLDPQVQAREHQLKEERLCRICMDRERDMVFLPCGHFVVCAICAFGCSACPICRQKIACTVKVYHP